MCRIEIKIDFEWFVGNRYKEFIKLYYGVVIWYLMLVGWCIKENVESVVIL